MSHGDLVSRMIFYTALALGSAPRLVRRLSVRVYKAITVKDEVWRLGCVDIAVAARSKERVGPGPAPAPARPPPGGMIPVQILRMLTGSQGLFHRCPL
ncbi:hypothetical protein FJTKL_01406 [Diaporthe vaccinii]|uniref:Uncharacterized protein n=1 Tax=Diaporthe vaccinii TaxID=105482 RepID=A0ABR4E0R2_9PEZI